MSFMGTLFCVTGVLVIIIFILAVLATIADNGPEWLVGVITFVLLDLILSTLVYGLARW